MTRNKKLIWQLSFVLSLGMAITACQKLNHPGMGDYPKDTNPPGGPLKFYTAFDGANVDSIMANFGTPTNVTYVDGIKGKAMSADANGHMVYPSPNDFYKSTSFTISFWVSKAGPNKAGGGTTFAFGMSTGDTIWTYQNIFLEFEDAGNPSTTDLAAAKFYFNDQWFEFVKTSTVDKRMPKVLDGNWHQLAFVYDSASTTLTPYVDGASLLPNLPAGFGKYDPAGNNIAKKHGKNVVSGVSGLVVGGPGMFALGKTPHDIGQDWMGNFNGKIDEFRLYGRALSATEITAQYTNKQ